MHSLTKWIGGHGLVIGGALVDGGRFDWFASGRHPTMTEPYAGYHGLVFAEHFGLAAFIMRARTEGLRDFGACLSPHNAARLLTGVETLSLRMERHVENTAARAGGVAGEPGGGLGHPSLARRASRSRFGGSGCCRAAPARSSRFGVKGGRAAGRKFIEALKTREPSRQCRRRQDARHPSGQHDAPADERRAARDRRGRRGHGAACRSAWRRRTTSSPISSQALRASQKELTCGSSSTTARYSPATAARRMRPAGRSSSSCTARAWTTAYGRCKVAGFAHHGFNVLAVDLPGHGGSAGPTLRDVGALADWTRN